MHTSLWTQKTHRPHALTPDATTRIIHVAGTVDTEALDAGRHALQAAGLRLLWDPGAHAPVSYLAASDPQRIREFQRALQTPNVRALICARGGYGTMRILDALSPLSAPERAPWLVGYSDITALHVWLNAQGVASIHGPMVAGIPKHLASNGHELQLLLHMLTTRMPSAFEGLRSVHPGRAHGRLIGGNLSLLQAMIGSAWLPHLRGVILFIEEVGEPAYRVDRMLQSLALSGRARGIEGIVFGEFTRCKDLDARHLPDRLAHWSRVFECPVVMGLPAGHGVTNLPIMLGVDYTLDAQAGTLIPDAFARTAHSDASRTNPPATLHSIPPAEPPMGAPAMPPTSTSAGPLYNLLQEMLDTGVCSGLQLVASKENVVTHSLSLGATAATAGAHIAPVTPFTQFDLASVSKAVSTAILCHQLLDEDAWSLHDRIPESLHPSGATLQDLLSHRSGLPAWERLYDDARTHAVPRDWLRQKISQIPLKHPPNTQCEYSDIGYMLLGWWLEEITQQTLDKLFQERIAAPLELAQSGYRRNPPDLHHKDQFAATEYCPWRDRILQGVVHDEHSQILGGVSGHAGLFSTATDVDRIARALLDPASPLLSKAGASRMWSKPPILCDGGYTLGWDTPTTVPSNAGSQMTPEHTVGHLGYAGTSLWIDRRESIAITLLTNRVHPTRKNQDIRKFRPVIHDAIMRELRESATRDRDAAVR